MILITIIKKEYLKAKICNHRKFYNHYYESLIKSSWSGSISFCLFPFIFTNANNVEPLKI